MATLLKLGPRNHGQPITNEELAGCDFVSGYDYEVIDERLYVSYEPDAPENLVEDWLYLKLKLHAREHPEVVNHVTNKARVFVTRRRGETIPEPDLAAYEIFPCTFPSGKSAGRT